MLAFNFNDILNKLVYSQDIYDLNELIIGKNIYTGIIDVWILVPFIFGRVAKKVKISGEMFIFANLSPEIYTIYDFISWILDSKPDLDTYSLVENDSFINFVSHFSHFQPTRALMKEAFDLKRISNHQILGLLIGWMLISNSEMQ